MTGHSVQKIWDDANHILNELPSAIGFADGMGTYTTRNKQTVIQIAQKIVDLARGVDVRTFLSAIGVAIRAVCDADTRIKDKQVACMGVGIYSATSRISSVKIGIENN